MKRRNIASGTPWETRVGYSRAVRIGPFVHVAGTTATNEAGEIEEIGDPYAQTRRALQNVKDALARAGADLEHVVRTRIYTINIDYWQEIGRAHGEIFGEIRPATAMVEVNRLIAPEILVEIEADAVVPEQD